MTDIHAHTAGTFTLAGKTVNRLGFGTMRLTGPGVWGEPADRAECVRVLRRSLELGVQLIDTADSYGPDVAEGIIREAIGPYPDDVLIATKAGLARSGPDRPREAEDTRPENVTPWQALGRPEYLRQQAEMSLRRLGVERIDLFQLHRVDSQVPLADQVGELKNLQDEGKISAIGLSQVSIEQIDQARQIAEIVSVQNRYNLTDRNSADVLAYCEREGIGFIPWAPVAAGELAAPGALVDQIAAAHDAKPSQIALAWLLATSPVLLPIPGTSKLAHLEENVAAVDVQLADHEIAELDAAAK